MKSKRLENLITYEQYIILEQECEGKNELVNGIIYAMTGGTVAHDRIKSNIIQELGVYFKNSDCYMAAGDTNLKIESSENGYYPDSMLLCGNQENELFVTHPIIVIEVLSKSTRRTDLTEKVQAYLSIPSLKYYLIFDYSGKECIIYTKNHKPQYETEVISLEIADKVIQLKNDAIYRGVRF